MQLTSLLAHAAGTAEVSPPKKYFKVAKGILRAKIHAFEAQTHKQVFL
jgi:hypothetical protein